MATLLDTIKQAIDMEVKGENAYREFAEEATDPFIKTTFSGLADDEVEHRKLLHDYAEQISKGNPLELGKFKDNNPQRIFGMSLNEFKDHAKLGAEQLKPFDAGIQLEKAGIEYYTKALAGAETDEEKTFFESLIVQENMHLDILTKAKEFLSNPQSSFHDMEDWLLDGGI